MAFLGRPLSDDADPDLIRPGHAGGRHRRVAEHRHSPRRIAWLTEGARRVELGLLRCGLEHRIKGLGAEDHGTGSHSTYQQTADHPSILTGKSGSGVARVLNSRLETEPPLGFGEIDDCPGGIRKRRGVLRKELEGVAFDVEGKSIHGRPVDLETVDWPRPEMSFAGDHAKPTFVDLDRDRGRFQSLCFEPPRVMHPGVNVLARGKGRNAQILGTI
jgi:hypothetical protein